MSDNTLSSVTASFSQPQPKPPPTGQEIDFGRRLDDFQDSQKRLQHEIQDAFPNVTRSQYRNVYVLLLSWELTDPRLPVSIEVNDLCDVFSLQYGFNTEKWSIPNAKCHNMLSRKILDFIAIGDDNRRDLKIVYYAGHGFLTKGRQAAWSNIADRHHEQFSQLKWSGIQNTLEEAQSDVLLLLDCCSSGTANTDSGKGTTELIAACGFNDIANPVGAYSFTSALITELKLMRTTSGFTVANLFNNILSRVQRNMPSDVDYSRSPLHVVLTQDSMLPRNIRISPQLAGMRSERESRRKLCLQNRPEQSTDQVQVAEKANDALFWLGNHHPVDHLKAYQQGTSNFRLDIIIWLAQFESRADLNVQRLDKWLRMIPLSVERLQVEHGSHCRDISDFLEDLGRRYQLYDFSQVADVRRYSSLTSRDAQQVLSVVRRDLTLAQAAAKTISLALDRLERQHNMSSPGTDELKVGIQSLQDRAKKQERSTLVLIILTVIYLPFTYLASRASMGFSDASRPEPSVSENRAVPITLRPILSPATPKAVADLLIVQDILTRYSLKYGYLGETQSQVGHKNLSEAYFCLSITDFSLHGGQPSLL